VKGRAGGDVAKEGALSCRMVKCNEREKGEEEN